MNAKTRASKKATDHQVELADDVLLLRAFRRDDAEAICEAVCESRQELAQWLSWVHEQYAISDTLEFLDGRSTAWRKEGEHSFAIIERASGQFVGGIGINQVDKAALRANLGYWLRTSATGRGLATRATRLLARWALTEHGLERIEIVAASGNLPSQQVAARAGATRECIARSRLRVRGVQHDAVVYSLVRSDLLGQNGSLTTAPAGSP